MYLEISLEKSDGETNYERLWTQKQTEGFGGKGGRGLGEPGGGNYGGHILHSALGVVYKQ